MSEINVNDFKINEKDTGSTGYQVAVLTKRIAHLTQHLATNKHDHSSRRGLLMMVARRRKLLDYAKRTNNELYKSLLVRLSLRHQSVAEPKVREVSNQPFTKPAERSNSAGFMLLLKN